MYIRLVPTCVAIHGVKMLTLFGGLCSVGFIKPMGVVADLCGGGSEYLHRSPESRKRRQKGSPVLGGITGLHCYWAI
jgi:hypothetical protein